MSLVSMTGFARAAGAKGAWRWAVELKCVNAKGLDLRLRAPAAFDRIEAEARARARRRRWRAGPVSRPSRRRGKGASVTRAGRFRAARRGRVAAARAAAEKFGLAPPTLDGLLAVRGVVEMVEARDDEAAHGRRLPPACSPRLDEAIAALARRAAARARRLRKCWPSALDAIAALTEAADENPARRPEAVRARLAAVDRGADWSPRAASTRTGCIRRRSCSPPRPTFARNSTG